MQLLHTLIIEDSENDALLLVRALRKGGYEPIYRLVQTEDEMRAALQTEKWDLIISDLDMPSFSALAALDEFKKSRLDLPFIIVSGAIDKKTTMSLLKAGAHDFIQKGELSKIIPAIKRELREAEKRIGQRKTKD